MASIGTLALKIVANAQQFESTLGSAGKSLSQFGGLVTKFLPAAGVAGLVGLARQSANAIDSTAKLANQLGITTEALAGLQHAAALSDVDSLGVGLGHLARKLGEASAGSREAIDAFGKIGLSSKTLAQLPLDQVLGKVLDQIRQLPSAAERAAAAFDIFGKQGLPFLNLGGSEDIAAATEKARLFGLTFSELDADKVMPMNDAISDIGQAALGVGNTLAIAFSPLVSSAADFASTAISTLRPVLDFVTGLAGGIGELLGAAIDLLSEFLKPFRDEFISTFGEFSSAFRAAMAEIGATIRTLGPLVADLGRIFLNTLRPILEIIRLSAEGWRTLTGGAGAGKIAAAAGDAAKGTNEFALAQIQAGLSAAKLTDELTKQIALFGVSKDAAKVMELGMQGIDQKILGPLNRLGQLHSQLEDLTKLSGAGDLFGDFEKQSKALHNLFATFNFKDLDVDTRLLSAKAFDKLQGDLGGKVAARAEQLLDQAKTPFDTFKQDLRILDEAFANGAIENFEDYDKAFNALRNNALKGLGLPGQEIAEFGQQLALLRQFTDENVIGLDEFAAAGQGLLDRFKNKTPDSKSPDAVSRGSQEDIALRARLASGGGDRNDGRKAAERQAAATERMEKQLAKHLEELKEIRRKLNPKVVNEF